MTAAAIAGGEICRWRCSAHLSPLGPRAQDVFAEMMPQYWMDAKGVVLVYDVTRIHTLEACGIWYGRLCEALGTDAVPGVIVANKVDLRERLVVTRQQGQQMAASLNMAYFECSALDGVETDAPFAELAKMLHGGGGADSP